MNAEKAALRKQLAEKIQAFPEEYITESNEGLFQVLTNMPEFKSAKTFFSYYSLGREVGTVKIIEHALKLGKTVTLPVCFKGGIMEARVVRDLGELSKTNFGLLEPLSSTQVAQPEELDFIIVPGLSFDEDGFRIGWGGGYYDRYLLRTGAFTAGVSRELLLVDALPREAHDVPVKCVVTEKRARLNGGSRSNV